jgi:DnaJ-class molecular chaperone
MFAASEFALLQQAKEVLADEKRREDYDRWMRSGLTIPYSEWCARKGAMHTVRCTVMHIMKTYPLPTQ